MNKIAKANVPFIFVWLFDTLAVFINFLFRRRKLTASHEFDEPFFIIGSGRSGNTLLRSMLVAGNEVSIPPESYVWPRIIRRYRTYSFLPWEICCSMVISEFEAYKEFYTWDVNLHNAHQRSRRLSGKNRSLSNIFHAVYSTYGEEKGKSGLRWGDKTPINTIYVDKLHKVFPRAQFIHIVRNPLDVVCSYVKAGLYNDYESAALFWKSATEKAAALGRKLPKEQFLEIQYEQLVSSPAEVLTEVCAFLGITYTDKLLDFWKNKGHLGDVDHKAHHANLGSPVSTDSIGKWKQVLTEEEVKRINGLLKR